MTIRFWGVRGSIPTPLTSAQIQSKIAAVVERIRPEHLESPETREAFLAGLPAYLMGTVGGNTTCLEIRLNDDTMIIIGCGSGIRELAKSLRQKGDYIRHYHIFFTHFHWDHLQGFPFFAPPAYDPRCSITFYSPIKGFDAFVKNQMQPPYFPVTMDVMNAHIDFQVLKTAPLRIGCADIFWRPVKHPGGCQSYKIVEENKSMIFSTDTELTERDFHKSKENRAFYGGTETIILDSQYTLDEAIEKYDWGHSSYSLAVDFAAEWSIPNLYLFHHEPLYDDKKIYNIVKNARWYLKHLEKDGIHIELAVENMELTI
jgi:phosphoribosyl 1,2-cyclic phosphodiesterase